MKPDNSSLVARLLNRGDRIEIINGIIVIQSASNAEVPLDWLKVNRSQLIRELLMIAGVDGYIYRSYSTGSYSVNGSTRADGVTLIFESLLNGNTIPVTYNVNLKRLKSTAYGKKGSPLPTGHFSLTTRRMLYQFWLSTDLAIPPRLSSFHDYMGKLKGLIFACDVDPRTSKINSKIIPLLTITKDQLLAKQNIPANYTDNSRTSYGQLTDNRQTKFADKEIHVSQLQQGLGPNQSACLQMCETSKQDSTYTRDNIIPIDTITKRPQDQSVEEWLDAYGD